MENKTGLTISESYYELDNGDCGKMAVFLYSGVYNPSMILDDAIKIYTEGCEYFELMSVGMDNPWMRIILSDINNMTQEIFDNNKHRLKYNLKS